MSRRVRLVTEATSKAFWDFTEMGLPRPFPDLDLMVLLFADAVMQEIDKGRSAV